MKGIERIKTFLVAGLFVSAVVLAAVYIAGTPRRDRGDGRELPADVQAVLRGADGPVADTLRSMQLTPTFFGLCDHGGRPMGLRTGVAMMRDLWGLLSPWMAYSLGEEAEIVRYFGAESERVWRTAAASEHYFYLCWSGALPPALLRAHSAPENADAMLDLVAGSLPHIAEIFFFPDGFPEDETICALSRDERGGVCAWHRSGERESLPTVGDFSLYLARGILRAYTFAGVEAADCDAALITLPLLEQALTLNPLELSYPMADRDLDTRLSAETLALFDYNLNKVGSYYESDTDTAVFVDTHGMLRAAAETVLYEATAQGGLDVTAFVRESDRSALTLYDDLVACEALVGTLRSLDRALFGGDAQPALTAVWTESDMLHLEYAYFYDNVRISTDGAAVQITVRKHKIVSVAWQAHTYTAGQDGKSAASQRWMLRLSAHLRQTQARTGAFIALRYAADENGLLRADWNIYLYD